MIRLWPRLLHLSFLTNIQRRTLSPKYLLIAAIPSSSSQWAFFPSANTIFHQIKTLLPGGNRFPVCSLLSHILPWLCHGHPPPLFFLLTPYPTNSVSPPSALYGFLSQNTKFSVCIIGASFHFPLVIYLINSFPTNASTYSFTVSSSISDSNINKHDHPTFHSSENWGFDKIAKLPKIVD